jgi:large subunit ribosomal protein L14
MKAISARTTRGLNVGSLIIASDNSGARIVRIVGVKRSKAKKGRQVFAKLGDWVKVSVKAGQPDMKGKVFDAVVIRQRKSYRRTNGERISFDKGNPKGTQIKGAVAREISERWPQVAKIGQVIV